MDKKIVINFQIKNCIQFYFNVKYTAYREYIYRYHYMPLYHRHKLPLPLHFIIAYNYAHSYSHPPNI